MRFPALAHARIPVIDLFAGPGGLGEGFSGFSDKSHRCPFKIGLSIEKDSIAHQTLQLRSFFRQFSKARIPNEYYAHIRGEKSRSELFRAWPTEAQAAVSEAWLAELGEVNTSEVRRRIQSALNGAKTWVLIGGPPCQAYSLAGRSRNKGIEGYSLANDPKAKLYLEYLQIIADFWPPVFVMENVKGLLSARIGDELVFDHIKRDLTDPSAAARLHGLTRRNTPSHTYTLKALTRNNLLESDADFIVRAEKFGIPQARHRLIVIGIRDDLNAGKLSPLSLCAAPTVEELLRDLPAIRSGLSKEKDDVDSWVSAVLEICRPARLRKLRSSVEAAVLEKLESLPSHARTMRALERGGEFVPHQAKITYQRDWFVDDSLNGICNHSSRAHIRDDLQRYAFSAAYAEVNKKSPSLGVFPKLLLPKHKNVADDADKSDFADRFRVQHRHRYSTTITSHISKDGHYYIHYALEQCRSLTVREAARLQTFPDNYFFTGPRTEQYMQVGNAVPPLLATQVAASIYKLLTS